MDSGGEARDEGMERIEESCPEELKEYLWEVLRWRAGRQPELTADDVWNHATDLTEDERKRWGRVLGPMMKRAEAQGMIESIGTQTSAMRSRHRGHQTVWRSLVHKKKRRRD